MRHSYEAEVSEDGLVQLREPLVLRGRHRAVVTVLEPLQTGNVDTPAQDHFLDWRQFVGLLKNSPHFNEDPVVIQKAMRDEWD